MDSAVITGLFTLGGVVVGGVLNQTLTYRLERRRAGWEAKKAARLFAPNLHRLHIAGAQACTYATTWSELAVLAQDELSPWEEHAAVFAGTLDSEEWFEIYSAVRAWESLVADVLHNARSGQIKPETDDAADLADMTAHALSGALQCGAISVNGVARKPVRRALARLVDRLPGKERRERKFEARIKKDFEERFGISLDG